MKRTLRRVVTGLVALVGVATVGAVMHAALTSGGPQVALAANTTRPIAIVSDVHIRPSPDTSQNWLATMPAGSNPAYICYADGQNVQGTTKWFYVTWNGVTGYYSSVADDVPLELQTNIEGNYGIPRCGAAADNNQEPVSGSTAGPQPPAQTTYNRAAAATWALEHAQDVQPWIWSGCTWFDSQGLWIGGLPQTRDWNGYTQHGTTVQTLPGTVTATVAPDLVQYLVANGLATATYLGPERLSGNAVPEAELGDVIAYNWSTSPAQAENERSGSSYAGITHLAFVTNIAPGQYPEVSEWGTAWPGFTSSYQKRGWTWSQNHGKWLQQVYPAGDGNIGVTALLLHINF